jgi:hypothetical protein
MAPAAKAAEWGRRGCGGCPADAAPPCPMRLQRAAGESAGPQGWPLLRSMPATAPQAGVWQLAGSAGGTRGVARHGSGRPAQGLRRGFGFGAAPPCVIVVSLLTPRLKQARPGLVAGGLGPALSCPAAWAKVHPQPDSSGVGAARPSAGPAPGRQSGMRPRLRRRGGHWQRVKIVVCTLPCHGFKALSATPGRLGVFPGLVGCSRCH